MQAPFWLIQVCVLLFTVYFSSSETWEDDKSCLDDSDGLRPHPKLLTTLDDTCTGKLCQIPEPRNRDDSHVETTLGT